jgi:plastocyanin
VTVRPRLAVSVAVMLVAVLLLGSVASAATFRVRAKFTDSGYRWRPKTLSVPTGSRVVWRMVEGTHNVTSISNNWTKQSGNIGPGGTTAFTFDGGGTYRYRCTLHSGLSNGTCTGMCGKVVVG